jgi:hypothetical protein
VKRPEKITRLPIAPDTPADSPRLSWRYTSAKVASSVLPTLYASRRQPTSRSHLSKKMRLRSGRRSWKSCSGSSRGTLRKMKTVETRPSPPMRTRLSLHPIESPIIAQAKSPIPPPTEATALLSPRTNPALPARECLVIREMLGGKKSAMPIPLKNLRTAIRSMLETSAQRRADPERRTIPSMQMLLAPNFEERIAPGTWKSPMPTRKAEEISPRPETCSWRSSAIR